MLSPVYPIVTPRLVLRPYAASDLPGFHDIRSRPAVCRYLMISPMDREQARELLEQKAGEAELARPGQMLSLAVVLPGTGQLIGEAVLKWLSGEHRQGEAGYLLHPGHEGNGYATEAAAEMLRLGFGGLGLHRITGSLDGRNAASAAVLERLGMRREAHLVQNRLVKGEWTDEVIYAMTAREWARRAGHSTLRAAT